MNYLPPLPIYVWIEAFLVNGKPYFSPPAQTFRHLIPAVVKTHDPRRVTRKSHIQPPANATHGLKLFLSRPPPRKPSLSLLIPLLCQGVLLSTEQPVAPTNCRKPLPSSIPNFSPSNLKRTKHSRYPPSHTQVSIRIWTPDFFWTENPSRPHCLISNQAHPLQPSLSLSGDTRMWAMME